MTLEQLRIFIAVADTLNMRRAAQRVNLTQPAVSAAVAALEDRHATRLFDRVGRGIALSEAGRAFLPEAMAVLERVQSARRVLDDLSGLVRGDIRIAASQTVATYWLPGRMARFATRYPGVHLHLEVGNTAQTATAVLSGEADIGFVEGDVRAPLLRVEPVGGDHIGLYASTENALKGRAITRQELLQADWALRESGSGTRDHLACVLDRDHGLRLDDLAVRLELPSNGAVLEAVSASSLITAVSDLSADARLQAGVIACLDFPLSARLFSRLTHRARSISRASTAFTDCCDRDER